MLVLDVSRAFFYIKIETVACIILVLFPRCNQHVYVCTRNIAELNCLFARDNSFSRSNLKIEIENVDVCIQ